MIEKAWDVYQRRGIAGVISRIPVAPRYYRRQRAQRRREASFLDALFDSETEYREYLREDAYREACEIYEAGESERVGPHQLGDSVQKSAISAEEGGMIYSLVRKNEPARVVETGVAHGGSSLFIAAALANNASGRLHSIDYPLYEGDTIRYPSPDSPPPIALPEGREPGWLLPEKYRSEWDLRIGRSQRELPPLLADLGSVDLFLHDSDHRPPCQLFEYELAWEWMDAGGLLLSHDIKTGMWELFEQHREPSLSGKLTWNLGYMRK